MRYVIDTEFLERGREYPIEILSLGMVAEDGRALYLHREWDDPIWNTVLNHRWLAENVYPHITGNGGGFPGAEKLRRWVWWINDFIGDDQQPEFWAYFADYDWVVFCQLYGTMIQLPSHFPQWCRDVKQLMDDLGVKRDELPEQEGIEHNALNDALWTKKCLEYLLNKKNPSSENLSNTRALVGELKAGHVVIVPGDNVGTINF